MRFSRFVSNRYLKAKRKQAFIGVISIITLIGITLGIAALNVALAGHNGMRDAFMTSLVGETGSLNIIANQWFVGEMSADDKRKQKFGFRSQDLNQITELLTKTAGVDAFTLKREDPGVLVTRNGILRFGLIQMGAFWWLC